MAEGEWDACFENNNTNDETNLLDLSSGDPAVLNHDIQLNFKSDDEKIQYQNGDNSCPVTPSSDSVSDVTTLPIEKPLPLTNGNCIVDDVLVAKASSLVAASMAQAQQYVRENATTESETPADTRSGQTQFDAAKKEWDGVQTVEPGIGDEDDIEPHELIDAGSTSITFNEAVEHYKAADKSHLKSQLRMNVDRHGLVFITHFLFGPPKLHRDLADEKELVFIFAAATINDQPTINFRILQTIYWCLTGSRFQCSRYGSHWEEVGFQGNDPGTDLRGVGILGLMTMLYFLREKNFKSLAADIFRLSHHDTQNFPFCVMGITITRIALQALREDLLNRECNRRRQVFRSFNDFYVGTFLYLYQIWKNQGKTIADSGHVIREVELFAKKNPKAIYRNLEDYIKKKEETTTNVSGLGETFEGIKDIASRS